MIRYLSQYYSRYVHLRWTGLYDTISVSISIRDILLELYDTISDSISIRDILLELYDQISDSISIRDILLELYDKISVSILFTICSPSVNGIHMIRYWSQWVFAISYWDYMILYQSQYYSRYPIGFIWYYIGLNKYLRYPIGIIW